jgi:TetR/AcrR family transcriptional regulator, transcriptional repressor for nem operon
MSRPREFDEGTALAAIRSTFWDHGYAATSVDDLVRATGLGKGSLYGAFGSKREMFVRALREYCEASLAYGEQALRDDRVGGSLRAYVQGMVTLIASSKRGCLLAKAIAELAGEDGDVDGIVGDFYRRYEELFVRTLRRARNAGALPKDVDPRRQARLIVAVLRGLESLGKAGVSASKLRGIAESALEPLSASPASASSSRAKARTAARNA